MSIKQVSEQPLNILSRGGNLNEGKIAWRGKNYKLGSVLNKSECCCCCGGGGLKFQFARMSDDQSRAVLILCQLSDRELATRKQEKVNFLYHDGTSSVTACRVVLEVDQPGGSTLLLEALRQSLRSFP